MTNTRTNLFVYGTLLFDDVVRQVTGRTFQTMDALLQGFSRHAIDRHGNREPYPAITPDPTGTVVGKVLLNVDESSLRLIDAYELDPPEYEVETVTVQSEDGDELPAKVYVAGPSLIPHIKGSWSPDEFQRDSKPR